MLQSRSSVCCTFGVIPRQCVTALRLASFEAAEIIAPIQAHTTPHWSATWPAATRAGVRAGAV
jgi:hypothetical protein